MRNRSVVMVIVLSIITFGIYAIYWQVSTKNEMNRLGSDIPTAWLIIIPIVSIWWMWKYCGGVEQVTHGKLSQVVSFLLLFLLSIIGIAIIQDAFNKVPQQSQQQMPRAAVV